jgi:predicted nuclease of predicted toxin-antitoxin system
LTLRLYLDDCAYRKARRRGLEAAGHVVTVPADVGLTGARDRDHFAYARAAGLVLLTQNPDDFVELHERFPDHPGILLVYRDNNRARDMTDHEIARAIANLSAAGVPIAGQAHILNHWQY